MCRISDDDDDAWRLWPHLLDKPVSSPINLLYHIDNMGLSKITHIIGQ